MEQNLSAQGLSGGASESTLASMRNNYQSNRNSNEEEYYANSAALNQEYQSQIASLENQYQQLIDALESERANAVMQNENALANAGTATINQFADYDYQMDYLNASSALSQQGQERLAALNNQYALEQMNREYALKTNYEQAKSNWSSRSGSSESAKLRSLLRARGMTDDEINALGID